jgi:hypothetical protein
MRRDFELLADDAAFLKECGYAWETVLDGSQWVLLNDFPVPSGYAQEQVTAAIRLETGYPDAQLDMVYFYPALTRRDGKVIAATKAAQPINGRSFQRWSRHRTPQNPWIAGQDSLATHLMLIEDWLEREFEK